MKDHAGLHPMPSHSTEVICADILEAHRDRIMVQKPHLAVANLAKIIEAALTLSNRQGFQAMTLRQLAEASGLSMGGLYSYIDGKDTLLSMVLGAVTTTVCTELNSAPDKCKENPVEHLRWLIERHIRLTEAMQPWFAFAFMEAKAFPPSGRKAAVESELATENVFRDVIKQGIATGVFQTDDEELAASLIKPLLQDWYVKRSKYRKGGVSIERYIKSVVSFVEGALQVCPTGSQKLPLKLDLV